MGLLRLIPWPCLRRPTIADLWPWRPMTKAMEVNWLWAIVFFLFVNFYIWGGIIIFSHSFILFI
jgi:hypothetical protein